MAQRARRQRARRRRDTRRAAWIAGTVALVALSFVVPRLLHANAVPTPRGLPAGVAIGTGLPAGTRVPAFSAHNLLTGSVISSNSVFDHKTLLFFSEGVSCQACLEQIHSIQQVGDQLARRGIQLISITPDPVGVLRQAASDYGITTPLISDTSLKMSTAFNTLGLGMHATTPGHAFVLIYRGRVLWYRDYWITNQEMYVNSSTLLSQIPKATA